MEGSLTPGHDIALSDEDRERMGKMLVDMTSDLETQHKPYIDDIDNLWKFYWAVPNQTQRNVPWINSSNVVYPLIQLHSDAIKARLKNTLFATHPDLVLGRTQNEDLRALSQVRADFFNWAADDNEFDLVTPVTDWVDEAVPIGGSVLFQEWSSRFQYLYTPGHNGKAKPTKVHMGTGPIYRRYPREQVLWQLDRSIQDSELVVTQSLKSRYDLQMMYQLGQITLDEEKFEALLAHTSDGGYTKSVVQTRREMDGLNSTNKGDSYDIRAAWVSVPLLRGNKLLDKNEAIDEPILPVLVWFERDSGMILRAMAKPYLTRGVPAYELYFRTAGSRRNPGGVASRLEHLQRAITTMYNQAIDAVTLSNSVNGITNDTRLQNQRFHPGKFLFSDDPVNAFHQLQFPKLITPDIALMQLALSTAERITGMNDPLMGRETRMGGHPSPAASTAMLLQESREMFRDTMRQFRGQFDRMAKDTMLLYQQFGFPDPKRLAAGMGSQDASDLISTLDDQDAQAYGDITFDLKVASETANQDQELQKAMTLLQGQMAYGSQVVNLLASVEKMGNQAPLTAKAAMSLVETLTLAWSRVLEAGREDEIKRFLIDYQQSGGAPAALQQFQQHAQGLLGDMAAAQGRSVLPPSPEATGIPPVAGNQPSNGFPGI